MNLRRKGMVITLKNFIMVLIYCGHEEMGM
jgi:hypothetical protein